jgi:hypothetical protein
VNKYIPHSQIVLCRYIHLLTFLVEIMGIIDYYRQSYSPLKELYSFEILFILLLIPVRNRCILVLELTESIDINLSRHVCTL